jgi:hypothetical protein
MKTVLAAMGSLMTAITAMEAYAQEAYTVKVQRVIDLGYGAGPQVIRTIANNTNSAFQGDIVTVTLYDAKNQILDTALGSVQNANGALPGQTAVWTAVTASGNIRSSQVKSALAVPSMVD